VATTLGVEFYDAVTQVKTGGFEVEFLEAFDLTPDGQYVLNDRPVGTWNKDQSHDGVARSSGAG